MDFVNTELAGWKLLFSLLLLESSYVYKLSFFPTGSSEDCICLLVVMEKRLIQYCPSPRTPTTSSTGEDAFVV